MFIGAIKHYLAIPALVLFCSLSVQKHTDAAREGTEWAATYWYNASNSLLPRVLIIGDSIVRGYQAGVRDQLAGVAYLAYHATSKSVTDPSFLREISYVIGEYEYEIILINNGLHSLDEHPEQWASALPGVHDLIRENAPEATIVWMDSTPLKDSRQSEKVRQLNKAARNVLIPYNISSLDLYSLMDPLDRNTHWADNYHFHAEARRMQAAAVSAFIKDLLGNPSATRLDAQKAMADAASDTGPDGRIITIPQVASSLIRDGGFKRDNDWKIYTADGMGKRTWNQSPRHSDQRTIQLSVTESGLQLYQEDPQFLPGTSVEISFWAKSSPAAEIKIYIRTRRPPYRYSGTTTLQTTEEWQQYKFNINIPSDYIPDGQALFFIFQTPAIYEIDDMIGR